MFTVLLPLYFEATTPEIKGITKKYRITNINKKWEKEIKTHKRNLSNDFFQIKCNFASKFSVINS